MKRFLVMFVAALIVLAMVPQASYAHVNPPAPVNRPGQGETITITGVLESIGEDNTWHVAGVIIHVAAGTAITGSPTVGTTVTVVAVRGADDSLVAQSVVVIIIVGGTPPATSTSAATTVATASSTASATASSTSVATQGSVPFVTIIIEGPVEQVDVNIDIIVVYGMRIKMKHDDPLRLKIKKGDWVHIKGHFDEDENHQMIVIIIIIVIIDTPPVIVVVPPSGGGGNGHHDDD